MWYFSWILGVGLALAAGILNVLWLEPNYALGRRVASVTETRFADARAQERRKRKR
jgi:cyd operon protein YbgT